MAEDTEATAPAAETSTGEATAPAAETSAAETGEATTTPATTGDAETGEGGSEGTATTQADGKPDPNAPKEKPGFDPTMLMLMAAGGLYLWYFYSKSKKQKAAALKKQEEVMTPGKVVMTIGGMYGEVIEASEKSITIKPDPKRELLMTFDRSAIRGVVDTQKTDEADAKANASS